MSQKPSASRVPSDPDQRRADRFAIGHDAFQFNFDFWQSVSQLDDPAVTRIMTTPAIARDLSSALLESLREYGRVRRALSEPPGDAKRRRLVRAKERGL
jgi:hypothetical protein